jgi:predicted small secreted protein
MEHKMKTLLGILILLCMTMTTIGCETTEGLGRDIDNAGDEIEDAVDDID